MGCYENESGRVVDCRFWRRRALAACVVMVVLTGLAFGVQSRPSAADPRLDQAQTVVKIVNGERKKSDCPALRVNSDLRKAAQKHAADMAKRNYLDHESPEGATPSDRAAAEGYTGGVGENIAMGYRNAQEVTKAWMKSAGHRQNIRDCRYRNTGVAVARAGNGTPYWVQVFGLPQ